MPRELKGLTKNPLPLEGRDSLEELSNERAALLKAPGRLGSSEGFALIIRALNSPNCLRGEFAQEFLRNGPEQGQCYDQVPSKMA